MAGTPILDLPFDGRKLRRARVQARLTQDALAQLCSDQGTPVSRFQVVRAESCKYRPLPDVFDAFAKALNCQVDDLLTLDGEVTRESA